MKPIASGHVFEINRTSFWCRLEDQKGNMFDAEIDRDKLSKREKPLLTKGAYLSLLKGGSVRFIRLKPWLKKEVLAAEKRAKKYSKILQNT